MMMFTYYKSLNKGRGSTHLLLILDEILTNNNTMTMRCVEHNIFMLFSQHVVNIKYYYGE